MSNNIIDEAIFSSSVFKDETTLYHGYIPPQLPFREKQVTTIAQNYRPLFTEAITTGGVAANIAVVGSAGVGKSASVRFTIKGLVQSAKKQGLNIYADYRNCWINRTRSAVLRGLLRDKFGILIRGFGSEEAIDVLIRRLTSEDAYLILILDEVSVLTQDDIESFLHLTEEFGAKHRFSVVMISRSMEWNVLISPEISQRISDVIHYEPYSREEMREILEYRASLAFHDMAVSPDLLEMVADISSSTQNLRHGIEILHRAGRIADRQNMSEVDPEMVRIARATVYPELRAEILHDLQNEELYILLGVTNRLLEKSFTATTLSEAYQNYKVVCDEYDTDPVDQGKFLEFVSNLETIGIISVLDSKRGKEGRRKRVTIHDVPAAVLKERIEDQLSRRD